jgi:hypothetical protein
VRGDKSTASQAQGVPEREHLKKLARDLRERLQMEAVAYSADGREFSYEAPISSDIQVGGWVRLETAAGDRFLGQVTTETIAVREGPQVKLDFEPNAEDTNGAERLVSQTHFRMRLRHTTGTGVLLAKARSDGRLHPPQETDTFDEATITAAGGDLVRGYLQTMAGARATLSVGAVQRCTGSPEAFLRADGFDRHTFLCGQSGSGKTYALGLLLEQLLLHTELNLVIIDPNSDFVRLNHVRRGTPAAGVRAYKARAKNLQIMRPGTIARGRNALRAWFSDLAEPEQASALQLDALLDRQEYSELSSIADEIGDRRYSLHDVLKLTRTSRSNASRDLALRIQNLGVADWSVWASGKQPSSADLLQEDTRAVVLDVGTLATASEKAVVAATVLGNLWRRREQRRPTLIVIDEAHNVCPDEPVNALQANATQYCVNIAAEGRKFGLYLVVSTQRPQKVHRNVLSQCDNLLLMRMNSRSDLTELSSAFSFVAASLLEEALRFRQGEALLAGRIVPAPLIARLTGRVSEEGGADIPASWAEKAPTVSPS